MAHHIKKLFFNDEEYYFLHRTDISAKVDELYSMNDLTLKSNRKMRITNVDLACNDIRHFMQWTTSSEYRGTGKAAYKVHVTRCLIGKL
jgi:hypothetical protein